jgi:hypothetical protein
MSPLTIAMIAFGPSFLFVLWAAWRADVFDDWGERAMPTRYRYTIDGGAADQQTWSACGTIQIEKAGEFVEVPSRAIREAFLKLTTGKAIYGHPGVGCRGPYSIERLLIEKENE